VFYLVTSSPVMVNKSLPPSSQPIPLTLNLLGRHRLCEIEQRIRQPNAGAEPQDHHAARRRVHQRQAAGGEAEEALTWPDQRMTSHCINSKRRRLADANWGLSPTEQADAWKLATADIEILARAACSSGAELGDGSLLAAKLVDASFLDVEASTNGRRIGRVTRSGLAAVCFW